MGDHYENLVATMNKLENNLKLCMPADIPVGNFRSSAHQKIVLKNEPINKFKSRDFLKKIDL